MIPRGVTGIKEAADVFEPESNTVKTSQGNVFTYDYLVVCTGIQLDWGKVPGLKETLGKNGVCSNYAYDGEHKKVWDQAAISLLWSASKSVGQLIL